MSQKRMLLKKSILLLEDDTLLAETLAQALTDGGYHAVTATTVKEALGKLKNQAFFCVVTDIRLNAESGEDLIDAIRARPQTDPLQRVPILVISGYLDRDLAERLQSRINGALVKPFTHKDLVSKLQTIG